VGEWHGSDTGSEDMVACRKGYLLDVTFYRALNDLSDTLRSVVSGFSVKGSSLPWCLALV
jgi:hypothetical protein